MHCLPSYPLKDCHCGARQADCRHFLSYLLVGPTLQRLHEAFPLLIPNDQHTIDAILNALPRRARGLKHSHWRSTWPLLLHTLRDIDICSHPDSDFEPEPDP
ncbi:hypothetical protein BDB00DRAFT_932927 [Zychaea mexicana]|uniref:uncharacterized protein n=1 Tax=Zychaea mexicana TaxID=64656 RepID=UPI0022FDFC88|nr:uncharacterized protein BDB00DRAFT_932927 [Zychaea mexicana]KAI9488181.1 hypothetical protein BDB00DRAFT_932927 [Zychaea mexicana]